MNNISGVADSDGQLKWLSKEHYGNILIDLSR